MKKIVLLLIAVFGSYFVTLAQDLITTKKGEDIEAKILEVSQKEIKYKKYNNLDGPTFIIDKIDVVMVRYESGDKDIFVGEESGSGFRKEIYPGMRYRQYKRLYHPHYYVSSPSDPYSPGWSGVASFFIPGLGQCISGEWGRGIGVFAANTGLKLLFIISADASSYSGRDGSSSLLALGSGIGVIVHGIWNIVDAVHVAKIKNMYYQELANQRTSLDLRMDPFITYTPTGSLTGYQPVAGVSLKVSF